MRKGSVLLNSIRIQNMRSLKDTGNIPLRPLTLLVGGNSSGKSTFLRTFPLIKQSLNKRTSGPILWAGDVDDYVDFGSLKEAKGPNGTSIDIGFSFDIKNDVDSFAHPAYLRKAFAQFPICKVEYGISVRQRPNRFGAGEEVSTLRVTLNKTSYIIESFHSANRPYSITIDGCPITLQNLSANDTTPLSDISRFLLLFCDSESIFHFNLPKVNFIWKSLESFVCRDSSDFVFYEIAPILSNLSMAFVYAADPIEFIEKHKPKRSHHQPSLERFLDVVTDFTDNFRVAKPSTQREVRYSLLLYYLYFRMDDIKGYIKQYFKDTHYIAPLRATAERFYRLRNLAVDEVDYQGKNMAVFLNSLSKDQLKEFQCWTIKHFNFVISLTTKAQHISVKISRDMNSPGVNISDSGFGYSQILPIIAELWFLSSKGKSASEESETPVVIAIEQPELHLHPALQAELVDAFVACIANANAHGNNLQLIIETHSETIVNRLGRCIARQKISADSAEIILFEKPYNQNQTEVKIATFDEDGMLENWPIGFFEPEGI